MIWPSREVVLIQRPLRGLPLDGLGGRGAPRRLDLPQRERSQRIGGQHIFPDQRDDEIPIGLGSGVRPVEVALGLPVLKEVSDHDDDEAVLLPDHPPEGVEGALHGALGGDVGPRLAEAVHEVGVDVLVVAGGPAGPESNPCVIVCGRKKRWDLTGLILRFS